MSFLRSSACPTALATGSWDRKAPLGVLLPQSFVKFMGTLDIRSIIGRSCCSPPFASGRFEKRVRNPDLCGGVNSATVVLLGPPEILNSFLPQLCSSRSIAHLASVWEPGQTPARMRAKRKAFGVHLGFQKWFRCLPFLPPPHLILLFSPYFPFSSSLPSFLLSVLLPFLPAFLLSFSCNFYYSPTVMSKIQW